MLNLEELKNSWQQQGAAQIPSGYDRASLEQLIRTRVKKHINSAVQYFWASFVLQMIVYALLCHVMISYWPDAEILASAGAGLLLYLPFTIVLMLKFKKMATLRPAGADKAGATMPDYVLLQQTLLQIFYRFKRRYELFLIPLSTGIGVFITFKLFVPGGVQQHWLGAGITYLLGLLSCMAAIRAENRKHFREPIRQLQAVLDEFRGLTP